MFQDRALHYKLQSYTCNGSRRLVVVALIAACYSSFSSFACQSTLQTAFKGPLWTLATEPLVCVGGWALCSPRGSLISHECSV